jgi:hypothetical protein
VKSRAYYANVQKAILASLHGIHSDISFDEMSEEECYIQGKPTLAGGFELHIAEYVITEPARKRLKYRLHPQSADNKLIARWNNAAHHPEVKTHPDHLHVGEKVKANPPMEISQVLEAVLSFIE